MASPYYPTNQEFTTVAPELAAGERHNETLFELRTESKAGQPFKSKSGQFKLVHFPSKVAMWTHTTPLPEWAFKQAEINGNKAVQQTSNLWYVDEIADLPEDSPRLVKEAKKIKSVPFLKKYFELQRSMFAHNNALTSSHPYASQPFQWPFLLRGVSFWTQESTNNRSTSSATRLAIGLHPPSSPSSPASGALIKCLCVAALMHLIAGQGSDYTTLPVSSSSVGQPTTSPST